MDDDEFKDTDGDSGDSFDDDLLGGVSKSKPKGGSDDELAGGDDDSLEDLIGKELDEDESYDDKDEW